MKTAILITITLLSGAIAGTFLGLVNQVIVEPYIDAAIEIETQNRISEGEVVDPQEINNFRIWQKGGEIVAGTVLGTSIGALFGLVLVFVRTSLPGSNNKKKGVILASAMFLVLFLVPFLKYPGNPPAVGDPETIDYRQSLYISMLVISGFSALGVAILNRKLSREGSESKKIIVPAIYAAIIALAFVILPANPDEITISSDLLIGFRIATAATIGLFWAVLGILLGSLWDKTRPHETTKFVTV